MLNITKICISKIQGNPTVNGGYEIELIRNHFSNEKTISIGQVIEIFSDEDYSNVGMPPFDHSVFEAKKLCYIVTHLHAKADNEDMDNFFDSNNAENLLFKTSEVSISIVLEGFYHVLDSQNLSSNGQLFELFQSESSKKIHEVSSFDVKSAILDLDREVYVTGGLSGRFNYRILESPPVIRNIGYVTSSIKYTRKKFETKNANRISNALSPAIIIPMATEVKQIVMRSSSVLIQCPSGERYACQQAKQAASTLGLNFTVVDTRILLLLFLSSGMDYAIFISSERESRVTSASAAASRIKSMIGAC